MAFPSTLRLGREAVSKTMQLKAWGLREFASAVFFSTKSEGSEKGKQKKSKMQQSPQNVVAPKEGVPAPRTEFTKKLSSPDSYPSAVNKAKTIDTINSDDIKQQTAEEIRKLLSRKTVVEFPHRVSSSSLKAKDTYLGTNQQTQKAAKVGLSSDSDSDSDLEDSISEIVLKPQMAVQTKGEFPQQKAFETKIQRPLKLPEKIQFQKAHMDSTHVEKPHQSEMKLTVEPSEAHKETKIPKSEVREYFREQSINEAHKQNSMFKLNKMTKDQKAVEIHRDVSDQTEGGSSTQLDVETKLFIEKEENREGKRRTIDFTADYFENKDVLQEQVPILNLEAPPPQTKEDILEENVPAINTGEKEEVIQELENQGIIQGIESAESVDNSTYKNLQHHNYNTYTFLDFHLDLLKFRLPQPSSGRESPRH
ncbi:NADH dehydrogenase [ubiquinone] flavoprotein 3, mitochondrial [Monodelphis domestica]|uniref:NADH:ubiquinone oxidoreductase subunit V3 n=1 Tax=Monodelphis domestica TaxID=13616 RepID=F6QYY9_MONDO|nr:NADH dehydrogenase [ubiquinone] flavoprotein 3, mitochondrial [Monodelphis domestica]